MEKEKLKSKLGQYAFSIRRDITSASKIIRNEILLKKYKRKNLIVCDIFRKNVQKHPLKNCIYYKDEVWTFQDLENYSNQVGNLFLEKYHLQKGDCAVIFLENSPQFIGLWLGLSKIGVISAFINTNLKNQQLTHSINTAKCKIVIYGFELESSISEVKKDLDPQIQYISFGKSSYPGNEIVSLEELISKSSSSVVIPPDRLTYGDVLFYIYTSGTTGLPKPAIFRNERFFLASHMVYTLSKLTKHDIIYVTLPFYHSTATIIGIGNAIICGTSIAIQENFVADTFWKDCIKYDCTAFIYVGEICRFLLNQPRSVYDCLHRVKKAIGNGVRPSIWREFESRFRLQLIEFYGSSEGNCNMVNYSHRTGACGFVPLINRVFHLFPLVIVKVDDQMNPVRNRRGLCVECKAGEKGLLVGIIRKSAISAFHGYANNMEETRCKTIRDVLRRGQWAFNSGDMVYRDQYGYMYFCDRIGDTYRWKGELVSTSEVESVLMSVLGIREIYAYGVEIANHDGKAGMVAILDCPEINLDKIIKSGIVESVLSPSSRPVFMRLVKEFEYTGTYKMKKSQYAAEGFDQTKTSDKIYLLDPKLSLYREMSDDDFIDILNNDLCFI